MLLFTCGPVTMFPSTLNIRNKGFTYFRTEEYGCFVKENLERLATLLGNSNQNSTIYLASSGTGAMEAVVENCINNDDKTLIINGGSFGKRFCEQMHFHNKQYDSINLRWNEELTNKHLEPYENKGYTTLLVNIHETSTGQLYNKCLLSEFCKRNKLFFIVDAISSFLADDFDMEKWGIDVAIISSHKGLCCSPGMSIISFSKRMKEKIQNDRHVVSTKYFDFKDYLDNIQRGQTPYTPAVLVMYELNDMLNLIENFGGINKWLDNIQNKKLYFEKLITDSNLKLPEYKTSNMLTPFLLDNINAYDLFLTLKNKYSIFVTPCGGNLASKLLRVSHIGNTNLKDYDILYEKLMISLK